ncbi:phage holin family protein [Enterobacter sp. 22466]|uniref:phage holin family protein n=1 Tax=Enterobacter sp. 22466 TaxID=3453924 RepID=UPI003F863163
MALFHDYLLLIDTVSCLLIVLRLLTFSKKGKQHRPVAAWFAWLLIVACGSVVIRSLSGLHVRGNWGETLINVALCLAVLSARGNVMSLTLTKGKR